MVLDDRPILKLIFQKYGVEIQNFFIGTFHFELLEALSDMCLSCTFGQFQHDYVLFRYRCRLTL